jgi:putative ABC transport system permease protein
VIGSSLAAGISLIVVYETADTALPIVMTPQLTVGLFVITLLMCIASALSAIVKVTRIDPASAFTR